MKKALSVILSVLVIFSMLGMVAAAEGESADDGLVTIKFVIREEGKEDVVVQTLRVSPGVNFVKRVQEGGDAEVGIPEKPATETTKFEFEHWLKNGVEGAVTYTSNVPAVTDEEYKAGVREIVYVAVFSEKEIVKNQTFWAFIESIFERINSIFEYFAKVFEGVIEF